MANELTITQSFTYAKGNVGPMAKAITALGITVAGNDGVYDFVTLSTIAGALNIGTLVAPFGYAWFHNADATQTITILTALSGKTFCKLLPGEVAMLRLGVDVTAPAAVAAAGTPILEYMILPP